MTFIRSISIYCLNCYPIKKKDCPTRGPCSLGPPHPRERCHGNSRTRSGWSGTNNFRRTRGCVMFPLAQCNAHSPPFTIWDFRDDRVATDTTRRGTSFDRPYVKLLERTSWAAERATGRCWRRNGVACWQPVATIGQDDRSDRTNDAEQRSHRDR